MVTQNIKTQGQFFRTGLLRALSILRPICHALISPQAVVLDTGGRARPLVRQRRNVSGSLEDQFDDAVSDLLQLIDDAGARDRRLKIVVSDFWARPLVLPLPGTPASDEEVDIVLQSEYRRTYGTLMDGWCWCWTVQGERLLAVSWPEFGLAALREGLHKRAGVLASARPLAIEVADQVMKIGASGWLAIVEAQSVTLVRQEGGVWQEWCVTPSAGDAVLSLPLQLARETARRQDDCRTVTIVDLNGTTNLTLIRKALVDAGWLVHVCAASEPKESLAVRLSQEINSAVPV